MNAEDLLRLRMAEQRARLRIFRLARSSEEADDIIQEAFTRLWAAGYKLTDAADGTVAGLLVKTAYHIAIDEQIKRDIRSNTCLGAHLFEEVIDEGIDPERSCIAAQELQQIQEFANSLPERQRQAFVLIQVLGYSYQEAATVTGTAVHTLESQVRASRNLMRQEDCGDQVSRYKRGFYTPRSARPWRSGKRRIVRHVSQLRGG